MPRPTPAPRNKPVSTALPARESALRFTLQNLLLIAAGLIAIIAGYVTLAGGSTVAAPLLLVLGYAVLIPIGIMR